MQQRRQKDPRHLKSGVERKQILQAKGTLQNLIYILILIYIYMLIVICICINMNNIYIYIYIYHIQRCKDAIDSDLETVRPTSFLRRAQIPQHSIAGILRKRRLDGRLATRSSPNKDSQRLQAHMLIATLPAHPLNPPQPTPSRPPARDP